MSELTFLYFMTSKFIYMTCNLNLKTNLYYLKDTRSLSYGFPEHSVPYLLQARTMGPQKQPLLANDSETSFLGDGRETNVKAAAARQLPMPQLTG
jgi:hypothetical protein